MGTKRQDHLGNQFNNTNAMCQFYGIPVPTFFQRQKRQWTLEECLTIKIGERRYPYKGNCKKCQDHLGNQFDSLNEMCAFYGITRSLYQQRKEKGMSLQRILMTSRQNIHKIQDHLGNTFNSKAEMCRYYGISVSNFCNRKKLGWSLEKILTTQNKGQRSSKKQCQDHLGNNFDSIIEMCEYHQVSTDVFAKRIASGYELADALCSDDKGRIKCQDHLGNNFNSIGEMCQFYHINSTTYSDRRKAGYTLEQALTKPTHNICKDAFGNEFSSEKEMCKHWGTVYHQYQDKKAIGKPIYVCLNIVKSLGAMGFFKPRHINNLDVIHYEYKGIDDKYYYLCYFHNKLQILSEFEIYEYEWQEYKKSINATTVQ